VNFERSPDAIVVGGGLIGCSTAYHLARAGVRTLLIEQGDLASGASGANFGNVQVEDAEFGLSMELTLRSYARFATLGAELNYDVGYRRTGNLLLIETQHQWGMMQQRAARLQAAGVRAQGEIIVRKIPDFLTCHCEEGRSPTKQSQPCAGLLRSVRRKTGRTPLAMTM
jgi:glycine/D-amino acid oxidase-like deaminating enzyme